MYTSQVFYKDKGKDYGMPLIKDSILHYRSSLLSSAFKLNIDLGLPNNQLHNTQKNYYIFERSFFENAIILGI